MAVCHENTNSMFPSRPSPTSFNFPALGYPAQANSYNSEFSQYGSMSDAPYQQPPWVGMYSTVPRPAHSGIEDWTSNYMMQSMQQPYNYSYRTPMGLDYSQSSMLAGQSPLNGSPPLTSSSGDDSPNGTGSKSLRAPYDWMKSTVSQVPANGKTRTKDKYRNVYTDQQRLELEKEFHYSKFITIRRKTELSAKLNLSQRQVKIWFQNRRAKERKQNKKEKKNDNFDLDPEESMSPPTIDNTSMVNSSHSSSPDQENIQPHYHHQLQYPRSISPLSRDPLSPPSTTQETMYKTPQHLHQNVKSDHSSMDLNNFYPRYMPYAS